MKVNFSSLFSTQILKTKFEPQKRSQLAALDFHEFRT